MYISFKHCKDTYKHPVYHVNEELRIVRHIFTRHLHLRGKLNRAFLRIGYRNQLNTLNTELYPPPHTHTRTHTHTHIVFLH